MPRAPFTAGVGGSGAGAALRVLRRADIVVVGTLFRRNRAQAMLGTSCSSIASTAANAGDTTRRDAPRVGVGLKNQRKDEKAGGPQRAAGAHWGVRRSVTHKQLFGSACEPLWATCAAFCHLTPSHLHENTNSIEYQFSPVSSQVESLAPCAARHSLPVMA